MSPLGATTTPVGPLNCPGAVAGHPGLAQRHQDVPFRAELENLVPSWAVAVRIRNPDVSIGVDVDSVRPDEQGLAESPDPPARRIVQMDGRQGRPGRRSYSGRIVRRSTGCSQYQGKRNLPPPEVWSSAAESTRNLLRTRYLARWPYQPSLSVQVERRIATSVMPSRPVRRRRDFDLLAYGRT